MVTNDLGDQRKSKTAAARLRRDEWLEQMRPDVVGDPLGPPRLDPVGLLDAVLDPTSANTALVPFDLLSGAVSPLFAALGTVVNLADLFS